MGVSFLHPLFLMLLMFALGVDALDLILDTLVITKVIGIPLDIITGIVISFGLSQLLGEKVERAQKRPMKKMFVRTGIVALFEFIPFVGWLPGWTWLVISTASKKPSKEQ